MQNIRKMATKQTGFFHSKVTSPKESWKKWASFAQWVANTLIPGLNAHIRGAADLLPLLHYPLNKMSTPREEGLRGGKRNQHAHGSTHSVATAPCTAPT